MLKIWRNTKRVCVCVLFRSCYNFQVKYSRYQVTRSTSFDAIYFTTTKSVSIDLYEKSNETSTQLYEYNLSRVTAIDNKKLPIIKAKNYATVTSIWFDIIHMIVVFNVLCQSRHDFTAFTIHRNNRIMNGEVVALRAWTYKIIATGC